MGNDNTHGFLYVGIFFRFRKLNLVSVIMMAINIVKHPKIIFDVNISLIIITDKIEPKTDSKHRIMAA